MAKYVIEIYQGKDKLWYWRLREKGGRKRIIADGAEGYKSKYNVKRGIVKVVGILAWMEYEIEEG